LVCLVVPTFVSNTLTTHPCSCSCALSRTFRVFLTRTYFAPLTWEASAAECRG